MKFFAGLLVFLPLAWSQTCAPRLPLQPTDSLSGILDSTNCRLSDNTLYAEYSLVLPTRGQMALTSAASAFDVTLILRDAGAGARISVAIEANQTYTLIASAGDAGAGAYNLSVAFTPADGESCRSLKSFTVSDSAQGNISPDSSCVYGTGYPNTNIFYNY